MNKRGFTLIELMIALAIILILAIIAVPRFTDLIRKSKEGETKTALVTLRKAISDYAGDNEGAYPVDITSSEFVGHYIDEIPTVKLGKYYDDSNKVKINGGIDDSGGWYYDSETGEITVNSNEKDTKGQIISSW